MDAADRADLLAYAGRLDDPGLAVARIDRWRRRAWRGPRIARAADAVAGRLAAAGVRPGDRVALVVTDGPAWLAAFFGALRAGAVAVPLDLALDPPRIAERARELDVAAWCTDDEAPRLAIAAPVVELGRGAGRPPPEPPAWPADEPERVAEIVLTSGTTGVPRAVPVTHANLRAVLDTLAAGIEERRSLLRWLPRPRLAVALPLSHLYGQVMGVFVPVLLGARVDLLDTMPAPDLARALRERRAWALATVPRTLDLLARHLRERGARAWGADAFERRLEERSDRRWPLRRLAFRPVRKVVGTRLFGVVSGGAALDPGVERFWRAIGVQVVQGYGLTETAPLVTLQDPFAAVPGTLGKPLPGVELRIAADGEILVRGPNVVVERLGGRAVDEEGWLHTGDLGRRDAEGRLVHLGRRDERVVTPAGVNVDPAPVVEALRATGDVLDAVVVERPWGEPGVLLAVLLPRPGADPEAAVREANDALPDAARIRVWRTWPEADFPRTATGKVRRQPVLERLAEEGGEEPAGPAGRPAGDPLAVVAAEAGRVAGLDRAAIRPDDRVADALGSLDRVELATRLEGIYGMSLAASTFDRDLTFGELARLVASTAGDGREAEEPGGRTARGPEGGRDPGSPASECPPPGDADGTGNAGRVDDAGEAGDTHADGIPPGGTHAGRTLASDDPGPPLAAWRHAAPVRAARTLLREAVLRPLWRSMFDLRGAGVERVLALDPPFLVAANHQSVLDPGALLFALPPRAAGRIAPSAMWEHFRDRPTGRLQHALAVAGLDLVPLVQRGDWRPTLRIAGRVADRGGCPLVFPEGERSTDGALLPFRSGVAILARDLHLPIVPCALTGFLDVLPKGARWTRGCWRGRAPIGVAFGDPFPAPRPGDDLDVLVAALAERIQRLLDEARRLAGKRGALR